MTVAVGILAGVAGLLAVLALVPGWKDYPLTQVACLLLAIGLFLLTR